MELNYSEDEKARGWDFEKTPVYAQVQISDLGLK
jgi:hypothetical protein